MSRIPFWQQMSEGSSGMRDRGERRRQPRVPQMPPRPIPKISLKDLFDRERTLQWYDDRQGKIGNAAGVDGVQLSDLKRSDVASGCGIVIDEILRLRFTPRRLRRVDIPRPDGRFRTLMLMNVIDRIVCGAAANYLTRAVAGLLGPNLHGSVPNRGVNTLLREVQQFILSAPAGQPIFVHEMDVVQAFDNVRLGAVTNVLRSLGFQDEVVNMIRRIMTPDGAAGEILGLAQGNPFSPILFACTIASCFQEANNQPGGTGVLNPLVYVDNVVYLTHQAQLLTESIGRHTAALDGAGLSYGEEPTNTATNLRTGATVSVLGNDLTLRSNVLTFTIPVSRVTRVQQAIARLALSSNPAGATRSFLHAYVSSKGHVFATAGQEYCNQTLSTLRQDSELTDRDHNRILRRWEDGSRSWIGTNGIWPQQPNTSELEEWWEQQQFDDGVPPWEPSAEDLL